MTTTKTFKVCVLVTHLNYIEQVAPSQLDTPGVSPSVVVSHDPLLPSVVMSTKQTETSSTDKQQILSYHVLVECDSDESTEL